MLVQKTAQSTETLQFTKSDSDLQQSVYEGRFML